MPAVTGTAQVGETLSADISGIGDADGLANVSYSYQWVRNDGTADTDITDATASTYTLVDADDGKTIKVRVSFTDDDGYAESLTSTATEAVSFAVQQQIANSPATGLPAVTGTAQVGETLTADTSGIADTDGLTNVSFSHQWIANDGNSYTDITSATESTYTLVSADEGKTIKVRVSFTDDAASEESLTSAATGAVAGAVAAAPSSYITVAVTEDSSDPDNIVTNFTVTWSDSDDCSTNYNIYLAVWSGPGVGQTTRTHIGSAASGSTQATLPIPHSGGRIVKVELYCGEYAEDSSQNVLVDSTYLASNLRSGTFSSAPLTALSVGSRTLSPSFNRGGNRYGVDVPSDERRVTLSPTGLTGYEFVYVRNPIWGVVSACNWNSCNYSYGDGTTTGIVLADVDPNTSGFQVDLNGGENRLGIGLHKGNEGAGPGSLYYLTITVQSIPASGRPTISGTAQVGQTLTANTSGISDEDGLDDANFSYQWIRVNSDSTEIDIAGATSSTYAVASADADKTIKVRVTFTDDAENVETLTSTATNPVAARPNTPATGAPIISGTAQVGETLTADTSGISDVDGLDSVSFSYQWLSSRDTDITGATDSTHTLAASDEGKTIKVRVSFTDDAGNDESLTSAATAAVVAEDPQPQEPPAKPTGLTGTVSHDAVSLSWDNPGDESVTGYQILRRDKALHAGGEFLVHVDDTGSASLAYVDEDVTPNARYVYRVKARNAAGLSERSEWFNANTPAEQADTTAPTISSIAITSDPDAGDAREEDDGVYGIGDAIEVTVTFSENVTVTGTPRLELYIGGPGKTAAYESVVGSTVVFSYTVAERDWDNDGIAISSNRLTLNGGSIKDAADNDADLSHVALSAQEDHKVDGIPPRVSGFYTLTTNRYTFDGVYTIGDIIYVGVSWSGNGVSVTGNPQLTLDFNGTSKTSNYVDGWLGSFSEYTVEEGDSAPDDGVAIPANAISLNGGAIKDRAGNDAVLTHPAFAADTLYSTQYSLRIPVDGIRPTITSIEIVSDPGDDDTYGAGDEIKVLVTFSENVQPITDGYDLEPTIELNIGGEARIAGYHSHSGTTVTFAYIVQSDDTDDDGISIGTNKVSIDTELPTTFLILDRPSPTHWSAGNPADVTHDAIADDSGHKVDGPSSTLIISGESIVHYLENEETFVGYYSVSGADADITWSLSGDDSDDFSITRTRPGIQKGYLRFQSPPNYEDPTDSDADNEYRVTLNVSDGTNTRTWPVVVLVVNALFDADEVPVIVGEARVGETLTVDISNITYDSTTMKMYYLWARIDGGTATRVGENTDSSYTLTTDDVGKTVGLTLSVLAGGFHLLVSEPTAVVSGSGSLNNPATGQPTISGTAEVGETLSAGTSGIADTDGLTNVSYSYQWISNDGTSDTDIAVATDSSYTLVDADEGKTIKVRVTFTDDAGNGESLTCTATISVAARPNTPATGAPTIDGTAQVGETLTANTSGISDADGLADATFAYQWLADGTGIAGATGDAYILTTSEMGKIIKVRVSFTDDAGNEETFTSTATGTVSPAVQPQTANSPATGVPTVTGTAQVGETLSVDTSGIADDDGLTNVSYSYQWVANDGGTDADISSETDATYTLVAADVGDTIKVKVTFTDDAGNEEALTSGATDAVAAADPPAEPTGLSATVVSHDTVTITWDDPQDDSITGYVILRRDRAIHPTGTFVTLAGDTGSADTTYTDETVEPDKEYVYRIKAINDRGEVSEMSHWRRIDTPSIPVPDKPTGLSTVVSYNTVTITWDDPQDDSITGYVILRRDRAIHPTGTFVTLAGDTGSADTAYTDETVEPDKEYVYRIKAINEHGKVSEISDWVRGFTPAAPAPAGSPAQ